MKFPTGRTYDTEQVLEIEVTELSEKDDFGFQNFKATFKDASRHIEGKVESLTVDGSEKDIGRAVLACYDMGLYAAV